MKKLYRCWSQKRVGHVATLLSILLIFGIRAEGGETQDYRAILKTIEEKAPQILRSQALVQEGLALPKQAKEWSNPYINVQTFKGSPTDPTGDSAQAIVLFPVDLAGVIQMHGRRAELEVKERKISHEITRQDVLRSAYLAMQKIRQLRDQMVILRDTAQSLDRLMSFFKQRPRLTPEQEALQEILRLAREENWNRLSLLEQESHGWIHDIEIQIQRRWIPDDQNLPRSPSQWPKLASLQVSESSPLIQKLQVRKEQGDVGIDVVRAEKKGVLLIGPALEWTQVGSQQGLRAGVAFQFPIPLLESYSGSRELAERTRDRAHIDSESEEREILGELDHSREIYQDSVKALEREQSRELSREKMKKMEQLFQRGFIQGSGYVELLRQNLLLRQSHDELEIKALDSWCRVQALVHQFEACFL